MLIKYIRGKLSRHPLSLLRSRGKVCQPHALIRNPLSASGRGLPPFSGASRVRISLRWHTARIHSPSTSSNHAIPTHTYHTLRLVAPLHLGLKATLTKHSHSASMSFDFHHWHHTVVTVGIPKSNSAYRILSTNSVIIAQHHIFVSKSNARIEFYFPSTSCLHMFQERKIR